MSSASIGGYEPPPSHGEFDTYPVAEPETGSTTDVAKDQAAQLGKSATESGRQVASTAVDEAGNVTAEARRQVKDLGHEVSSQAQQQAALQKDKAAHGLHSVSQELRSMSQHGQSGPVTDLAHQAADKVSELATWLEQRDPGSLLEEVRSYARRKPGTFLLGAAAAGVVVGRLTRGAVQASQDDTRRSPQIQDSAADAANGRWGESDTSANIGGGATLETQESTTIADRMAVETLPKGYEPAGQSL